MGSKSRGLFDFGAPTAAKDGAAKDGGARAGPQDLQDLAGSTPPSGACSNLPVRPASHSLSGIVDVQPTGAANPPSPSSKPSKKKKSTIRKFSVKSRASSGYKQRHGGLCRRLEADLGAVAGALSGGDASSRAARSVAVPVRSPVSTARKGLRRQNVAIPIQERAERRAAAKDLCPPGTLIPLSPTPSVRKYLSEKWIKMDVS